MTPVSTHTVNDALHWRYATKKFDPSRKIPAVLWAALEQALVLSPSTMGLQPWKFVVVQDRATREKLSAAAWDQSQPLDCSHFVVFSGRKGLDANHIERHVARTAEVRGVSRESLAGFAQMLHGGTEGPRKDATLDGWMARQVYIALGMFIMAASVLGVDTCPMEGIEGPKFDEILGLSAMGYGALFACAAGYRSSDDKYASLPKVRFKPQDVVVHV
jgi:nitroreductase